MPVEVLSNEIVPVEIVTAAPVEEVVVSDEKIAEPIADLETAATMPEKTEVMPETMNEVLPVVEGEILEPAASEIVVAEAPVVSVTQAAPVAVAAVAATTVKQTSEEEEGLIEGIVNTLIDDDADGEN